MDSTVLLANLSAVMNEHTTLKRKRNTRMNSMVMWAGATQSTSNLAAQAINSSRSNKNLRQTSAGRVAEAKEN